jgi:mannose-6-phosphate isomerase-like protein (cupin superfamily)
MTIAIKHGIATTIQASDTHEWRATVDDNVELIEVSSRKVN